jgi:type VI protein secretion system component Hcp
MKKKPGKTGGKRPAKKPVVKDLGATNARAVRGGAGKVSLQDIHFTKTVDTSSPTLS